MNLEVGQAFLKALGVHHTKLRDGIWLTAPCPLAPWKHKTGQDRTPSFALEVDPTKPARFHCFACESGSAMHLLNLMLKYVHNVPSSKYDFGTATKLVVDEEVDVLPLPEWSEFGSTQQQFEEWPDWFVESFQHATFSVFAMNYVEKRGLTAEQAILYNLRWDHHHQRLCFPYRNVFGKLAGMRGRSVDDNKLKHYDYTCNKVNNTKLVWYNEPVLEQDDRMTLVVEGQIDALRIAQVYPKVVANMTAMPTVAKLSKLAHGPGFILIPDQDKAGTQSLQVYRQYAEEKHIVMGVLDYSNAPADPAVTTNQNPKDPAEIRLDWLYDELVEGGIIT